MKKTDGSLKQPLWAEEFSVHGAEDKYVLRRQFTKFLVLTSFGMFVGNVWIWVKSLLAKDARHLSGAIDSDGFGYAAGGVKLFQYPTANDPCIMVRTPDQKLVAYSQKCTHLSCAVYYSAARTGWNVLAMKATFRLRPAVYCKVRRRGRFRGFGWSSAAIRCSR